MKIHPTFVKQSETSATGQVSLSSFLFIFPRNGFSLRKVAVPSVQSAWHGSRLHAKNENTTISVHYPRFCTLNETGILWPKIGASSRSSCLFIRGPNHDCTGSPNPDISDLLSTGCNLSSVLLHTAFVWILCIRCTQHIPNELFITNYLYYVSVSSMTLIF